MYSVNGETFLKYYDYSDDYRTSYKEAVAGYSGNVLIDFIPILNIFVIGIIITAIYTFTYDLKI
jgi:hypothetical protein